MSLPREVKRQAKQAKDIQAQLRGEPVDDENVVPLKPDDDASPDTDQNIDWEHRFKTQKQKYDEAVPALRTENEQQAARIAELEGLIEKAKPEPEPAVPEKPVFTEAEIEEYGEDFLNLITRVAGAQADPTANVSKELSELKTQFDAISQSQAKTAQDRFFDDLTELVPDWEKVNEDDAFKAWLAEEMPMTGMERQAFLNEAQRKNDARKVASFFTAWKGESGQQSYLPDAVNGGSGQVGPDVDDRHEIYTAAEVAQFYDDKKLGRYKGREDEARQIELKIFRAQKEGRIR